MGRPRYEQVEHTADTCIRAFGKDLNEIFANAAFALFDQQFDLKHVTAKVSKRIEVSAPDSEVALVRFLSELLYVSETGSMVFKEFDVRCKGSRTGVKVSCVAKGEPLGGSRHGRGILVKAIPYNMLKVDVERGMATIVFDT
jgi:SHS2 domain-containing protein